MGNKASSIRQHLYILKVSNPALPVCPFIHTITKYNGAPIVDTDPRIFREILLSSDLALEIMDIRSRAVFDICVPRGTARLGVNVVKTHGDVSLLKMRVTNVREGSALRIDDHILGIENMHLRDEDELVEHIKSSIGSEGGCMLRMVLVRNGAVCVEEVEAKDDMGCELGMGILHRVGMSEYYMANYDGGIRRQYSSAGAVSPADEVGDGDEGYATDGERDMVSVGGNEKSSDDAGGSGIEAHDAEESDQGYASDHEDRMECSLDRLSVGVSIGEEGLEASSRPGNGEPGAPGSSLHDSQIARIYGEAGLEPENKFLAGTKKVDGGAAVLINQSFANKEDLVGDGLGIQMKAEAFERRREEHDSMLSGAHSGPVHGDDAVSREEDGAENGRRKESCADSGIFDSDGSDVELPFPTSSESPESKFLQSTKAGSMPEESAPMQPPSADHAGSRGARDGQARKDDSRLPESLIYSEEDSRPKPELKAADISDPKYLDRSLSDSEMV